jgi:fatty acid desaturase
LFLYDEHVAHHSAVSYGTLEDSEYLPLRPARLVRSMALMAVSVLYPLLGPLRFAVFTPLALVSRRMNRFVFTVMSSLYNLKPGYRRAWVAAAESPSRWFQEIACCLWAWAWIGAGVLGFIPPSVFWKTYVLFVLWMALNQLRTLTAHRYDGDGSAQGSLSQLLDSNTFDRGWLAEAWAPLGLRYHALHHLLPAVPYHNLGIAHRRLTNALPADSPYHQTRQAGLWPAILDSFAYGVRVPTLEPACTPATGRPERPESIARSRSLPN